MAYTSFTNCTVNEYTEIIYSQDDKNKAKIWFGYVDENNQGTELQDFGTKCEKITKTARINPIDGKKIFSLSNFVSTEIEVILHDVNLEDIVDQVKISIGTLVDSNNLGDVYEYVPLGIFNIQDTPVINDNKITLKLRDNRVKFEFGYNAKPLIDAGGGSTTKRAIFEDICSQAGVDYDVDEFEFEDDEIGIYDNTIKGNVYIYYLAEQCGCIPTINRLGKLIFVDLSDLYTWRIPKSILPKPYTLGTPYEIQRVVYEQGTTKYESSSDETLDTLFLDSANPYINRQEQIDYIYDLLNGFSIDTVKTQKMLGNPAIDPYDIIEVYDDSDENETVLFRTLANQIYTFNGKHKQEFSTEIGKEERKENVKKKTDDSVWKRWATSEINNIDATLTQTAGKVDTLDTRENNNYQELITKFDDYTPQENFITLENSVTALQTDTYTKTEINTKLTDGSVTKVMTTSGTFDENGMTYEKTNAPTKSTINEIGLSVRSTTGSGEELLFAGYDENINSSIVRTANINVTNYLVIGNNSRMEDYEDGTGVFDI